MKSLIVTHRDRFLSVWEDAYHELRGNARVVTRNTFSSSDVSELRVVVLGFIIKIVSSELVLIK